MRPAQPRARGPLGGLGGRALVQCLVSSIAGVFGMRRCRFVFRLGWRAFEQGCCGAARLCSTLHGPPSPAVRAASPSHWQPHTKNPGSLTPADS